MNMMSKAAKYFELYKKIHHGDKYPELGDGALSIEPYISPEYFELEREKIFRKAWMKVGHESMIPKSGDFFVKDLPVLQTSIIVVRGSDGVVRGFHNTCTHRGSEIVPKCAKGNQGGFSCPFHAWTFDTQGRLRGVPDREKFAKFNQNSRDLTPVAVECWKGFIFINANPIPDQTLAHYLGTLGRDMDPYPFDRLNLIGGWATEVACNWKVLINAFQEGYHVASVHKRSVPTGMQCTENGQARAHGVQLHGRHSSIRGSKNPDWAPLPVEMRAFGLAGASLLMQEILPGQGLWPGINLEKVDLEMYAFDMNTVFPTTQIALSHGLMFSYEYHPISHNRTRYEATVYRARPSTWSERIGQEFMQVHFREGLREDLSSVEGMQRGLESGAIKNILLNDEEIAVRHFYHEVEKIIRG